METNAGPSGGGAAAAGAPAAAAVFVDALVIVRPRFPLMGRHYSDDEWADFLLACAKKLADNSTLVVPGDREWLAMANNPSLRPGSLTAAERAWNRAMRSTPPGLGMFVYPLKCLVAQRTEDSATRGAAEAAKAVADAKAAKPLAGWRDAPLHLRAKMREMLDVASGAMQAAIARKAAAATRALERAEREARAMAAVSGGAGGSGGAAPPVVDDLAAFRHGGAGSRKCKAMRATASAAAAAAAAQPPPPPPPVGPEWTPERDQALLEDVIQEGAHKGDRLSWKKLRAMRPLGFYPTGQDQHVFPYRLVRLLRGSVGGTALEAHVDAAAEKLAGMDLQNAQLREAVSLRLEVPLTSLESRHPWTILGYDDLVSKAEVWVEQPGNAARGPKAFCEEAVLENEPARSGRAYECAWHRLVNPERPLPAKLHDIAARARRVQQKMQDT